MITSLADVRPAYDRWSALYDAEDNPLTALEGPIVRALIGNPDGLNALDLGCGTGRHALWLASAGAHVTAIDFSEGMLAKARAKSRTESGTNAIRFLAHDLHQPLPFPDGSFNVLVSGLVLEHLSDLDSFFAEAHRVLQPEGQAIVSAMHPAMFLRGTQARFTDPTSGELIQPGSRAHSISAFVMAALRAGFTLSDLFESAADEALAAKHPRAEKYVGWPMLVVLSLRR